MFLLDKLLPYMIDLGSNVWEEVPSIQEGLYGTQVETLTTMIRWVWLKTTQFLHTASSASSRMNRVTKCGKETIASFSTTFPMFGSAYRRTSHTVATDESSNKETAHTM